MMHNYIIYKLNSYCYIVACKILKIKLIIHCNHDFIIDKYQMSNTYIYIYLYISTLKSLTIPMIQWIHNIQVTLYSRKS